jgi:phospholipase/carboxylesterase
MGGLLPEAGDLPLLVREAAGDAEGALVLLHGRGVDERDLHPLLDEFDPDRRLVGMTPGAPYTHIPPGGRHWYVIEKIGQPDEESFVASLGLAARFIDDWLREQGIPWKRTVIGGFSQGAAASYAVAFGDGRPQPAGVLGMSGFVPMVRGWRIDMRAKRGMPAYVTHGAYDPIIPVGFGRRSRDLMEQSGIQVIYREPRVQHSTDPRLYPEIRAWVADVVAAGADD